MQVTHTSVHQQKEWNAFVAKEPAFALFQAWEWGTFKEQLGWKVYRIAVEEQGGFGRWFAALHGVYLSKRLIVHPVRRGEGKTIPATQKSRTFSQGC